MNGLGYHSKLMAMFGARFAICHLSSYFAILISVFVRCQLCAPVVAPALVKGTARNNSADGHQQTIVIAHAIMSKLAVAMQGCETTYRGRVASFACVYLRLGRQHGHMAWMESGK